LALLGRKERIACLRHGGGKDILAADIDALAGGAAELLVKRARISPGEVFHAADAEQLKIPQHGRPNGDQVLQTALLNWHKKLLVDIGEPDVVTYASLI
jgi:hypothetical protein